MRDFTTDTLHLFLSSLISAGYSFKSVAGYLENPSAPAIILRHDVDSRPGNSLVCAEIENRMGITGTYYFRTVPQSFDETVIRKISSLGHEIGYHYEDLAVAKGDFDKAIRLFRENLAKLRRLAPVETICMHGSPLSKHDNRLLWDKYSYKDSGIRAEAYIDTDFRTVHYLTDTGRRWNGDRYSVRDRAPADTPIKSQAEGRESIGFSSTFDIIRAADANKLPSVIMMTLHPQRWNNSILPWLHELVWQNTKNVVKRSLTTYRS